MAKNYFKIIPAVYLVLRHDNQVLLLQRANTGYQDGMYSLPAGHLDGDETLQTAMAREAAEEIGLQIVPEHLNLVHVQHRKSSELDLSNERVDFYFECSHWTGEPDNREPHKCSELAWKNLDELSDNVIDHVRIVLECINGNISISNYGW
jgi:8-oxo-dGTP diphosphatase